MLGAWLALGAILVPIASSRGQAPPGDATGVIAGHIRLTTHVRAPLPANAYPSRSIGKHDAPAVPEIS
jgi:hypothetical protein